MAAVSRKSSSSSSSMYDVFLSFRGSDTRSGFTDNLYKALVANGISTFIDENQLPEKGVKEIEDSRSFVVVFSKNYIKSSSCMDELVRILDRSHEKHRLVIPVFYCVDPSELRYQNKVLFDSNSDRVHKWTKALHQASNLSTGAGFHFKPIGGYGSYEYELIDKIINMVSTTIGYYPLLVADQLVGVNHRVEEVEWYLDAEKHKTSFDDAGNLTLGITGVAGVGKTTLARQFYNSMFLHFEAFCFLGDVAAKSRNNGLVHLQQTLLGHLCGDNHDDLLPVTVTEGIQLIKERIRYKKVLLILDDVDDIDQLQATIGSCNWFGSGSCVIITTRNKPLLASHGIQREYELKGLPDDEALELLCWKAFKSDQVHIKFIDPLYRALACASGIPLALELIGSNLRGKRLQEWDSTLDSYEKLPHMDIQMILQQTYNTLNRLEKQLFLDITCFFKDCQITKVEQILAAHHGLCPKSCINTLIEKSLIKVDQHGCVTLHDLIRNMGIEIVRQESPDDPGKRSRLWYTEDIVQVLQQNTGTSKIQIIVLDSPKPKEVVQWDGKAFMNMKGLRTLIIRDEECFSDGPRHLPNSLRVLEWWGYPSQSFPPDFYPNKLDILKLPYSCFSLQPSKFEFVGMEILNLDKCEFLTHIPDVSGAPNLEKLSFLNCENLVSLHESVGYLNKLRILNAGGCKRLSNFPPIKLTSLEFLNLSYCSTLISFPEILGNMKNIAHISLEYTAVRELPYSIENLSGLQSLELHRCGMLQLPSIIAALPRLEKLRISQCEGLKSSKQDKKVGKLGSKVLSGSYVKNIDFFSCNISDEFIEIGLTWFANVKELDLSMNNFTILPAHIQECHFLSKLQINYCMHLREIEGIPLNLEILSAIRCTSLKELDLTVLASNKEGCFLRELILDECENLQEIRGTPSSIVFLSARNCRSLTASCRGVLLNQELHESGNKSFCLPGSQMPQWFKHFGKGHSISFWFRNKFPAISICLVGPMHKLPIKLRPVVIINGTKMKTEFQTQKVFNFEFPLLVDHILIFDQTHVKFEDNVDEVPSEDKWNHVVVSIHVDFRWDPTEPFVVQTGLRVIEQISSIDDIQFTNPYSEQFVKRKQVLDMRIPRRKETTYEAA